jgi:hypothetical protein
VPTAHHRAFLTCLAVRMRTESARILSHRLSGALWCRQLWIHRANDAAKTRVQGAPPRMTEKVGRQGRHLPAELRFVTDICTPGEIAARATKQVRELVRDEARGMLNEDWGRRNARTPDDCGVNAVAAIA